MPHIFTLPGSRSGPDNVFATQYLAAGEHRQIAAGAEIYSSLEAGLNQGTYWSDYFDAQITNAGTIWNISPGNVGAPINAYNLGAVRNSGLIVSESPDGSATGVSVGSGGLLIDNDGAIYAIGGVNATGIEHWDPEVRVDNDGLIVAYAPTATEEGGGGGAVGVALFNGGLVHNRAGASILAEGRDATALIFSRGQPFDKGVAEIRNAGRIEAYATDAAEESIAILTAALNSEHMRVENSGLIRAEVAYRSHSEHYSPPGQAVDDILNLAAGRIYGLIDTRLGADRLVNRGLVRGDVRTGEGDDLVDSAGGLLVGRVVLGWGEDRFVGGTGGDSAVGGRDGDRLEGREGNDLLLGGVGDDVLIGGAGNDGLYGEYGDDRIVAVAGDRVVAGPGDDVVEARDLRFALIDGGAGFDRLVLAFGADNVDLAAVRATGRVKDIEAIETRGGQRLVLRSGDVGGLSSGDDSLRLLTVATDRIELVGGWVQRGAVTVDGVRFRRFTLGEEEVLIAGGGAVAVAASPSAPAGGLDPVASGGAAPTAGSVPGVDLSSPVTILNNYALHDSETVAAHEIWRSNDGQPVLWTQVWDFSLINYGLIESIGPGNGGAKAIVIDAVDRIVNHGTIRAEASDGSFADAILSHATGGLTNYGLIEAIAEAGEARGVTIRGAVWDDANFVNHGTISARTDGTDKAVGAFVTEDDQAFNHGTIKAVGGAGTIGLQLYDQTAFVNYGVITAGLAAGASGSAIGLAYTASVWDSTYVNHGLIRAGRAIVGIDPMHFPTRANLYNFGRIEGSITLANGDGWFENMGVVVGTVRLGAGHNGWFGSGGAHQGSVSGGDGSDILIGSAGADALNGDAGNDLIRGGRGADSLAGGAGRDVFVYGAVADSTAAAFDTIAGFNSGSDKIDLSALDVQSVSFKAGAGFTQLVAVTAAGTLSVRVKGTIAASDLILVDRPSIAGTASADLLVATDGGSVVKAGAGDDFLVGSADADRLEGGAGDDLAWGGAGNDVYRLTESGDTVWEASGQGVDLIELAAPGLVVHLPDNVENARLIQRGFVVGNDLANVVTGSSGDDSVRGGGGDDRIEGGAGDDRLYGEGGVDTVVYASAAAGITVHLGVTAAQNSGGAGIDTLAEFENVIGSAFADSFGGNEHANVLDGGGGADLLGGGAGDDIYLVDHGGDKVVEIAGEGVDLVQSSVSFALGDHVENLVLTGAGAIGGAGNAFANFITGNAAANLLDGGGGGDIMTGGKGNDTYVVDDSGDTLVEAAGEGADTVRSAIAFSLAGLAIEHLVLIGAAAIDGAGNGLANSLTGNAAANRLDGGGGGDAMAGGKGDDSYVVDHQGDLVTELAGEGADTVRASVSFSLAGRNVETLVLTGGDAIDGTGNGLANSLTGNGAANRLDGGAGADIMAGGKGDDIYLVDHGGDLVTELAGQGTDLVRSLVSYSLAGLQVEKLSLAGAAAIDGTGNSLGNVITGNGAANRLFGDAGGDRLAGGGGGDSLSGGPGNDRLYGGAGHDSLRGGADADGFYFDAALGAASNVDAILDFSAASDTIFLDRAVFAAIGAGALGPGAFRAGAAALDADDRILYQASTGKIFYDSDGNGGGAAVLFATLTAGTALTHADFVIYG